LIGVVKGGAPGSSQTFGDAPDEKRDVEVGGDSGEQTHEALLFGGFHGDDRVARVNQQAQGFPGGIGDACLPFRQSGGTGDGGQRHTGPRQRFYIV